MTAVPARTAEVPARARRRLRDLRELRGRGTGRAGRCCGVARAGLAGVLRAGASRVGATWVAALGRAGFFAAACLPAGRLPGVRVGLSRPGAGLVMASRPSGCPPGDRAPPGAWRGRASRVVTPAAWRRRP